MDLHTVLRKHGIDPDDVPCGALCGPGWVPLIDQLITDLVALGWDRELHQIKEKLGGLRFYVVADDDRIYDRIHAAEDLSTRVCEDCGAPGRRRGPGVYRTRCDGCEAAMGAR